MEALNHTKARLGIPFMSLRPSWSVWVAVEVVAVMRQVPGSYRLDFDSSGPWPLHAGPTNRH